MQGACSIAEADDVVEGTATKRVIMAPSEARNAATAMQSRSANSNEPTRDASTARPSRNALTAAQNRTAVSIRLPR